MKCQYCGARVEEADEFCFSCGARLHPDELITEKAPPPAAPPKPPSPPSWQEVEEHVEYGGFWRRFLAAILDGLILFIPLSAIDLLLGGISGWWFPGLVIDVIVGVIYWGVFESSEYQATPGKMALGIIVSNLQGERLTFGRAATRQLCKLLSDLTLGIGYIIIGFTARKQGLHDLVASTLVIRKESRGY